jgi:hypothetical protein
MRLIQMRPELPLPPATGEGWDGGDARLIYAASNAQSPIPAFPHIREGRRYIYPARREY